MSNYRRWSHASAPEATLDEARAIPSFLSVVAIHKTNYSCPACAEHRAEAWIDGSACEEHRELVVSLVGKRGWAEKESAELALKVLRAGGNPEPRFTDGIGAAQWNYKRPRKASDRDATVLALTRLERCAA